MGGLGAGRREDGHADPVLGPQRSVLICHLWPARRKAREVAAAEALGLLRDLEPVALAGGPLAEQGGIFWLGLSPAALQPALARLPRLGYTWAVDLLEPATGGRSDRGRASDLVRRRGDSYALLRAFGEDAERTCGGARLPDEGAGRPLTYSVTGERRPSSALQGEVEL